MLLKSISIFLIVFIVVSFSKSAEARYLASGGCLPGYSISPTTGLCEGPAIYDTVCDSDGYCWEENPHCAVGASLVTNIKADIQDLEGPTSWGSYPTDFFITTRGYPVEDSPYNTIDPNITVSGRLTDTGTVYINYLGVKYYRFLLEILDKEDPATTMGRLSRNLDVFIKNKNFNVLGIQFSKYSAVGSNLLTTYNMVYLRPDGTKNPIFTDYIAPASSYKFKINVTANYLPYCEQNSTALSCPSGGHLSGAWCICTNQVIPTFTDPVLTPGSSKIRATHINELRTQINNKRDDALLTAFGWTDSTITPGVTKIRATHLSEMRNAINQVYQTCGQPLPVFTDPIITPGATKIRATHINELRNATTSAP